MTTAAESVVHSLISALPAQCMDPARDPYIAGRGMPNLVKMLMNT